MASKSSRRIFVTGGSGNVGSAVVTAAVSQGHTVHALSRSTVSDTALRSLGAVPVRGDLAALDILAAEAAAADAAAAVDAMARALEATTKPLVVTSGTLVARADPNGGVTDETAPVNKEIPGYRRWEAEAHALAWAARGVRVVALRMPMCVYGHGKSGPAIFLGVMAKLGVALYVGDGATHVSAVHLDDAARLYLLAAERGKAGDIFNCVSATVAIREVVEAVGAALQLPCTVHHPGGSTAENGSALYHGADLFESPVMQQGGGVGLGAGQGAWVS
ncbi:NAD-dependent epimerase/dehydratase [Mycena sanguinolenta]|uniref:NAD-dependent epimerase/dehydratase n=1 Tax=Mycena sanguinolenta TaxID=230812 RepID=A0A8H7DC13_9AGAR|nr:NAD-dependent epimerase/dehydratase [Mycena sanguinolenta]